MLGISLLGLLKESTYVARPAQVPISAGTQPPQEHTEARSTAQGHFTEPIRSQGAEGDVCFSAFLGGQYSPCHSW